MSFQELHSDEQILAEVGERLARARLDRQMTQAELAEQAGVSKRTLERLEAGDSTQLLTLVKVMRILGLLSSLDSALPATQPRPLDLLKLKGRQRQRASRSRGQGAKSGADEWQWGE